MKKYPTKLLLVNTFGTLGYLTSLLQWGWIGILYLPVLLENEQIKSFLYPDTPQEPLPTVSSPEVTPVIALIAFVVTLTVIILTIAVLLRAPVTVAKTGKTVTTKAADSALPLITRGRPLPKADKKRLTAQLIKLIKLSLVLLPVALGFIGTFIPLPLPFELTLLVNCLLALSALTWFSLQYILARILAIRPEQLV